MKKLYSILLCVSLLIGICTPATAAGNNNYILSSGARLISSNNRENVAEAFDDVFRYEAHYDKTRDTVVLYTYFGDSLVDTLVIDLHQTSTPSMEFYANEDIEGFYQSETGFGFLLGTPITEYACSYELVENGTYQYQGIRVRNNSCSTSESVFQTTVKNMIDLEGNMLDKNNDSALAAIISVIFACFGQTPMAISAAIASFNFGVDYERMANELASDAKLCGDHFKILTRYKV